MRAQNRIFIDQQVHGVDSAQKDHLTSLASCINQLHAVQALASTTTYDHSLLHLTVVFVKRFDFISNGQIVNQIWSKLSQVVMLKRTNL